MRHTIEVQFEKNLTDGVSTFIAFVRAIKGKNFDRFLIGRWFKKLVDEDDYAKEDYDTLLQWLHKMGSSAQQNTA